jgi:hypothetical protein
MQRKLPTLPKHMRSLQVFRIIRVAQSLALCVVLVRPFGNPIFFKVLGACKP